MLAFLLINGHIPLLINRNTEQKCFLPYYYRYDPESGDLTKSLYQISCFEKYPEKCSKSNSSLADAINCSTINLTSLNLLSSQNFPAAFHYLGDLYFYGHQNKIKQNFTKALEYYKQGAKNGLPESYSMLSFMYRYGIGMRKKDILISKIYETIAANKFSVSSMLSLSFSHTIKRNSPLSYQKASKNLLKIANSFCKMIDYDEKSQNIYKMLKINQHNNFAKNFYKRKENQRQNEFIKSRLEFSALKQREKKSLINYGEASYHGLYGIDVNYQMAKDIFEENKESSKSLYFLAKMYHHGHGVNRSLEKAKEYYKESALLGESRGFSGLGVIEIEEKRLDSAAGYLKKASEQGNLYAKYNYAKILLEGTKNHTKNPKKSLKLFESMKDQIIIAKYAVSVLLLNGRAKKYDEKKAVSYLLDIISYGPWIQNTFAAEQFFISGQYINALLIWMQMADMGIEEAAFNAGFLLFYSKYFFRKNPFMKSDSEILSMAEEMFKISKKRGNTDSYVYLAKIYKKKGHNEKAYNLLKQNIDNNFAKEELGIEFLKGEIVPKNYTKAFFLLKNANRNHDSIILFEIYISFIIDFFSSFIHFDFNQISLITDEIIMLHISLINLSFIVEIFIVCLFILFVRIVINKFFTKVDTKQKID